MSRLGIAGRLFHLSLLLAVSLLICHAQTGQAPSSMRVKVVDPNHAAIVGARVAVRSRQTDLAETCAVTDYKGEVSFSLAPGEYTVHILAEGFADALQTVHIKQAQLDSQEILLPLAESSAMVTVTDGGGYLTQSLSSSTRIPTVLRDIPQSITVITKEQIRDQAMASIADVASYIPGIMSHQGENNRDQLVIRGNSSSADFFLNGLRDDVQYYRDLYSVDRVEALKGPNAMIFGRGGGGGVINRVTKEAGFTSFREITLQGGSFGNKRFTGDFDQALGNKFAFRVNGLYEHSGSFRDFVNLERYGINPTLTIAPGPQTRITVSYENFHDKRIADRGIPSVGSRPADIPISTYFGNPNDSPVRLGVNLASATVDHQVGRLNIRNRTFFGDYDKYYQNYVPGAVTSDQAKVAISAYNNSTKRRNAFNQTDLTYAFTTGRIRHTALAGVEVGRQLTDNLRNTGFFNNTATIFFAPFENPTIDTPIVFRPNATDAKNHLHTNLGAVYGQDQIEFSRRVQIITGLRFDYFDLRFDNNRNGETRRRIDRLVSPRVGVVFKPVEPLSVYGNYSVSYLPSSGDQFSSLTAVTEQLKPEKFNNYEVGAKWDFRNSLSLTMAAYRLDRTNTRATDPNDPTKIVQTGSQRTNGFEIGVNGSVMRGWGISGGYGYQDAFITNATTVARAGAKVAQVPHHTFSLWNTYQILPKLRAGLGFINRSDMFAAVDNAVTLPGYTRADVAVYYLLTERWRLQANFENLFDRKYFINADGNNNISPGRPRGLRVGLTARF